jgi:folate-binding protein YgfZ
VSHLQTSDARTAPDSADYDAVVHAAGVVPLDRRIVVRVTGDDRVSFFHGICTADVKGARPCDILPALFLTEHAHVIADAFIWITPDALLLDIDAPAWTRTRSHLERLIVADDVEFEERADLVVLDIEGPAATAFAEGAASLAPWRFVRMRRSLMGNLPRYGGPAVSAIASRDWIDSIVTMILAKAPRARVDASILDTIRVENGIALVGVDTGEKTIALEARLDRAISFNKGCYLGQETIERATARGGLKKRMFGLKFTGADAPDAGAVLILAGKEVGRVTSAVRSPRFGAIGLATLHHSAWTPGTELKVGEGGGIALVSDLPFAPGVKS